MSDKSTAASSRTLPILLILCGMLLIMVIGLGALGKRGQTVVDRVPMRAAQALLAAIKQAHAPGLLCLPQTTLPPAQGQVTRQVFVVAAPGGQVVGQAPSLARTLSVRCESTPGREGVSIDYLNYGQDQEKTVTAGTAVPATPQDQAAKHAVKRLMDGLRPLRNAGLRCSLTADNVIEVRDQSNALKWSMRPALDLTGAACQNGQDQSWVSLGYQSEDGLIRATGDLN